MVKKNACIFISGKGSNLKNLINKSRENNFPIKIKLVICNNQKAYGLKYAKKNCIPYKLINSNSRMHDNQILNILGKYKISIICLAGYMKILSKRILKEFKGKIINIHPSLLPKFKGLNTYNRILKNKEIKTGCTVHFVNEKLDSGEIILKKSFFLNSGENESSLKIKTQKLEYLAFPEALIKIYRYS